VSPLFFALAVSLAAPGPKDKPAALDLTGEWEVTAYILDGMESPPGVHIKFATDGTTTFFGGESDLIFEGTYTFDPKKSPAEVDIEFRGEAAQSMIGIVKRDGDGLLLSFTQTGTRPTKFESPAGSGVGLLTLKRVMPKD
jgi:uncharacterized protein (TIGR03067 family)